jgi:hypothetical protein
MAAGHAVTGLSVTAVGLAITWIAALACAWALFELGRLLRDARTGVLFAVLWALMPSAVIQGALYADTLAICLSAWALYALLRRSWLTAAVLACLAGATRPTADAIVLTVCLAVVVDFVRARGRGEGGIGLRPWAAFVIAPIGAAGFLAYVAYRMGSVGGYLNAQRKWGTGFGNAGLVLHRLRLGVEGTRAGYANGQAHATTVVLLSVPVLIAVMLVQRQRWEVSFYTIVVAALVYTAIHDYTVVPREMLAAFPILLAPAGWLARVPRQWVWVLWVSIALLAVAAGWYAHFIPVDGGPGFP